MVDFVRTAFGLLLLVVGILSFRHAHYVSLVGEQLDAIGSQTPVADVEPAGWSVFLTKVVGGGMALFGAMVLAIGLLAP